MRYTVIASLGGFEVLDTRHKVACLNTWTPCTAIEPSGGLDREAIKKLLPPDCATP